MAPIEASHVTRRKGANARSSAFLSGMEVDLHQSRELSWRGMMKTATRRFPTPFSMPPLSRFKKFDVRPLLKKGIEPLPEILKRIQDLRAGDGLIIVAPFLPSPL